MSSVGLESDEIQVGWTRARALMKGAIIHPSVNNPGFFCSSKWKGKSGESCLEELTEMQIIFLFSIAAHCMIIAPLHKKRGDF